MSNANARAVSALAGFARPNRAPKPPKAAAVKPKPAPVSPADQDTQAGRAEVVSLPVQAAPVAPAAPTPNFTMSQEQVIADATRLGKAEGEGLNSRHELAMVVAEACSPDVAVIKPGDDIKAVWTAYQNATRESVMSPEQTKEKSFQVQCSKLNAVARMGAHPKVDGVATLGRTRRLATELRAAGETNISLFDAMVKVSREHASRDTAMSDDEIREALRPAVTAEKTELKELERALASMRKIEKDFASQELAEAIAKVELRISKLAK